MSRNFISLSILYHFPLSFSIIFSFLFFYHSSKTSRRSHDILENAVPLCVWHTSKSNPVQFPAFWPQTQNSRSRSHYQLVSSRVIRGCLYGCYISTSVRSSSNRASHGGWSRKRARARYFHLLRHLSLPRLSRTFPIPVAISAATYAFRVVASTTSVLLFLAPRVRVVWRVEKKELCERDIATIVCLLFFLFTLSFRCYDRDVEAKFNSESLSASTRHIGRVRATRALSTPHLARFVSPCVKTRVTVGARRLRRRALGEEVIWIYRTADRLARRAGRKAARCEPDEPRTNGATNQWCDGPSLLLLTQRVYHTENRRTSLSSALCEGRYTDPPLPIPHARSPVLCRRSVPRAKMIWRFLFVAPC